MSPSPQGFGVSGQWYHHGWTGLEIYHDCHVGSQLCLRRHDQILEQRWWWGTGFTESNMVGVGSLYGNPSHHRCLEISEQNRCLESLARQGILRVNEYKKKTPRMLWCKQNLNARGTRSPVVVHLVVGFIDRPWMVLVTAVRFR